MKTLLTRSISGLIFVALVVLSLMLDPIYFLVFSSIVVGIGLFEFHKLFSKQNQFEHPWSVSVTLGLLIFFSLTLPSYLIYTFGLNLVWLVPMIILVYGGLQLFFFKEKATSFFLFIAAILYTVIPFYLGFKIHIKDTGTVPLILGVFLLVWTNDTFAYLSGNIFGKHKLYEKGIPHEVFPPTMIKKFGSGKGNANKEKMIEAFEEETSIDIREKCGIINKSWNPITDIVDAYYICKYGFYKRNGKLDDSNI